MFIFKRIILFVSIFYLYLYVNMYIQHVYIYICVYNYIYIIIYNTYNFILCCIPNIEVNWVNWPLPGNLGYASEAHLLTRVHLQRTAGSVSLSRTHACTTYDAKERLEIRHRNPEILVPKLLFQGSLARLSSSFNRMNPYINPKSRGGKPGYSKFTSCTLRVTVGQLFPK